MRILVIDDSAGDRLLYERWLVGHELRFIDREDEARRCLRGDWDLVILDYRIPGVVGNELVYFLDFVCRVPWFVVSGDPGGAEYKDVVLKDGDAILERIRAIGLG